MQLVTATSAFGTTVAKFYMNYDLDFNPHQAMVVTHKQKSKVKRQAVHKLEWKQTDIHHQFYYLPHYKYGR